MGLWVVASLSQWVGKGLEESIHTRGKEMPWEVSGEEGGSSIMGSHVHLHEGRAGGGWNNAQTAVSRPPPHEMG